MHIVDFFVLILHIIQLKKEYKAYSWLKERAHHQKESNSKDFTSKRYDDIVQEKIVWRFRKLRKEQWPYWMLMKQYTI